MSFPLPFVAGHRLNGEVYEFPHRCPGADCAVAEWLYRKSVTSAWYRRQAAAEALLEPLVQEIDLAESRDGVVRNEPSEVV